MEVLVNVLSFIGFVLVMVASILVYALRAKLRTEWYESRGKGGGFTGRIRRIEPYASSWWIVGLVGAMIWGVALLIAG